MSKEAGCSHPASIKEETWTENDTVFFEMRGISKEFPGVKALDNVGFSVEAGEVRALVGENGAGKSTLMKILNGNYKKDSGTILIDGEEVNITNPQVADALGITIIFQELNLVDELSITENIFAGRLTEGGKRYKKNLYGKTEKMLWKLGVDVNLKNLDLFSKRISKNRTLVNWRKLHAKAKELMLRIGFDKNPKTLVGKLTVAEKQMVEIAKALNRNSRIILMDEPSATLTKKELDALFRIIRDLKQQGIAVIYISHRMEEIFEICESVTVLRDGQMIGTRKIADVTNDELVEMMVGREVSSAFPKRNCQVGEEVLRVENLCRKDRQQDVSFSLHKGEVLGIAGLVGAGRTEIMRAIFGVDYINKMNVYVHGKKVKIRKPEDAKRHGVAFLTENRKLEGLTLDFTVQSNIVAANLKTIRKGLFTNKKKEADIADEYIEKTRIKTPHRNQKVGNLSGGNQQKVVVSKWLNSEPEILIMDEPTRGIDVGAKREIYETINELVAQGKAIIMISSELPEVLGMSDRVLVMKDDAIVAELTGDKINAVEVMRYAL